MRITLIIPSLTQGGAERVLVLLAEGFIKKGYQVSVITIYGKDIDFYKLPDEAYRLDLNISGISQNLINALWNNIRRLWILRQAIKSTHPDLAISFGDRTNILTMASLFNTSYPVIPTEHCDPVMNPCGKVWEKLRHLFYPHAAKVVSVSQGINSYFDWLPKTKRAVIYNPFIPLDRTEISIIPTGADSSKKWIIGMGRLTYQKGFDLLLTAFKKIASQHPDWQLLILGQGHLKNELEKLKEDLCLSNQVIFTGAITNPFPILSNSKLFVMASRFEGFPMAHGEALACGLPVICTDCPSGPREIIRDGIDGILVPNGDIPALAAAMDSLMSDDKERMRLATRAPEVTQRFSLEKILQTWEALFAEVIGKEQK